MSKILSAALALFLLVAPATAGEADVIEARATNTGKTWRFDVTVRHGDTGWDHYVTRWEVVGPDGTKFGERVLLHPHEHEQPFTRSQNGITVPDDVKKVTVRAYDNVHHLGGVEMQVNLPE